MPAIASLSRAQRMGFNPATDSAAPPAGTPAIISEWASLSLVQNGVPCFNCVGNPPISDSLGIVDPQAFLPHTSTFEITYAFYNVREGTNSCTLSFSIKQGTTSLLSTSNTINLNGNGQYAYAVTSVFPSAAKAGKATVSAGLKCGAFTAKNATETVYLH